MHCPTCNTQNSETAQHCQQCGAALFEAADEVLAPGTTLQDGAYVIDRVLGQGGFGITYLATDSRQGRAVAIKEFFPVGCYRKEFRVYPGGTLGSADFDAAKVRFFREASSLARFRHAGIVEVEAAFHENGTAYMAMEYVPGKTLGALVNEGHSLSQTDAIRYILDAGEALEVVHQAGMLHLDIKPENLMLRDDGRVVLIDFGTARDFAAGGTHGHTVVLTPGYAPLEQYARRTSRSVASDVYSLAATLYFLLTGVAPPPASDRAAGVDLVPPHQLQYSVSPVVGEAVTRAMELKVDARPQTIRDFLEPLRNVPPTATEALSRKQQKKERRNQRRQERKKLEEAAKLQAEVERKLQKEREAIRAENLRAGTLQSPSADTVILKCPEHHPLQLKWPQQCASCGGTPTTTSDLPLVDETFVTEVFSFWKVPYCAECCKPDNQDNNSVAEYIIKGLEMVWLAVMFVFAIVLVEIPKRIYPVFVLWFVSTLLLWPVTSDPGPLLYLLKCIGIYLVVGLIFLISLCIGESAREKRFSKEMAVRCTKKSTADGITTWDLLFTNPQYRFKFMGMNEAHAIMGKKKSERGEQSHP